ncbi:hypothetical protein RZS28_11055 [Methylocapsa polymorpha]|uniref:Orc1-like AAA ATPase domain-containing protein n=1 Tax=Methylocapsa polymorpha TaxID=3080828 RepID=A0ABZ0HM56_9HYPH|nr:hypothetical protein RZS28_11055 [Methylocapsa sp. RX1]
MTHAFACWTAASASAVIPAEALEGADAIFLATHTPMQGFDLGGPGRADIHAENERSVLEALSQPDRKHAFCVVQGEPGSGKSHLIRWLSVNWPKGDDVKLLLRRSDGSLEGALRQLKERLPAEFEPLFAHLGQRHRAAFQGRANIFLGTLAETLESGHFDPPLDDDDWCRKRHPADLLRHGAVRKGWTAPARILALLEGAGGQRNSATADFDLFDIEDLARYCGTVRGSGVSGPTEELARRLIHESDVVNEWRNQGWNAVEIAQQVPGHLRTCLEFLNVLNRRRNHAIQNVLGVSAEGLKALFRQVREVLAKRGQRLILLLEDITSWEGLDDSLIDVLVFNAAVRGDESEIDVCPLISVVGVTPAYYGKLQGNYRGRITHEVLLGRVTKELQDVATFRHRPTRLCFAARYLAAVRAGVDRLNAWAADLVSEPDSPPPNICMGCNKRASCVGTFGEVDGVSLFPFTANALDRLYDGLKESDNGLTWKTPRGMLQAVLLPSLAEPQRLDEGSYPGVAIEPLPIQDHRRADYVLSSNHLARIIETQMVNNSEGERGRMRRIFAYWGDPERAETTEVGGDLALAGVSRSLLTAFNLPWIGSPHARAVRPAANDLVEAPAAAEERAAVAEAEPVAPETRKFPEALRPGGSPARKPEAVARPMNKGPTRPELERLRDELRTWSVGHSITNATDWNKTVHFLVRSLDARTLGLPQSVLDRLVTLEMVKLEGTTSRQRHYLSIGPEAWVRSGLEAYVALKPGGALSSDDQEYNRRKLAAMMRRLGILVSDYVDQRLGRTEDGRRWSPVPVLTQILLARCWLRCAVSPDAPWSEQLRVLLSDEEVTDGDRKARSAPWQEWLSATDQWHNKFRIELRKAMNLSLGEGQGVADLSEAAGAMLRLRETLRFDVSPSDGNDTLVNEYDTVKRLVIDAATALTRIRHVELAQLVDRGKRLMSLLGGRGIAEHLSQVDKVISVVSILLPDIAPEKVGEWKRAFGRIQKRLNEEGPMRTEAFLVTFDEPETSPPADRASLLGWLARAPARDLEDWREIAVLGEQVMRLLLVGAKDIIGAGGSASLEEVHQVGRKIQDVLDKSRPPPTIGVA